MAARKNPRECTAQERVYAMAFVETGSMTEAFKRGYPKSKLKGSARNASAKKVARRTPVRLLIEELQGKQLEKHEGVVDKLKAEYEKLAFFDISQAIQWGETVVVRDPESGEIVSEAQSVQIKSSKDMPPQVRAAIASIEQTKDGCLKVRFHDKKGALDSLAKMNGLFKEVHEHGGKGGGPLQVQVLEPQLPPKDVCQGWGGKYLGGAEKHAPTNGVGTET